MIFGYEMHDKCDVRCSKKWNVGGKKKVRRDYSKVLLKWGCIREEENEGKGRHHWGKGTNETSYNFFTLMQH